MTEQQLQDAIVDAARLLGYRVAHFRPAQTGKGWRTAVAADGAGFPDLTLARPGRLIFAELKTDRGSMSSAQTVWQAVLKAAGAEFHLWRPADWHAGRVDACLRRS